MPFQSLMNNHCAFQASLLSAMLLWHFTQSCCLIGSRVLARLPLLIFLYFYRTHVHMEPIIGSPCLSIYLFETL